MRLKGKLVRKEGTYLIFGSRNKPEWRPIEITGHIDPTVLQIGSYYEIDVEDNRLIAATRLDPGSQQSPASQPSAGPEVVRMESLMASATGVVKSLLEQGKAPDEAFAAGLWWASLWRKNGAPAFRPQPSRPESGQPPGRWTSTTSYTNHPGTDDEQPPF